MRLSDSEMLAMWKDARYLAECSSVNPGIADDAEPSGGFPDWTLFVSDIVEEISNAFCADRGVSPRQAARQLGTNGIPFGHLYRPIVELTRKRVVALTPEPRLFAPKAWRGLQHHLAQRISSVISPALHVRFLAHKAVTTSGIATLFQRHKTDDVSARDNRLYLQFVAEQGRDGLRSFFLRYPVAGRLIAETCLHWIEAVKEFVERLTGDEDKLSKHFKNGQPVARLSDVKTGVSDPHNGGRSVFLLSFADGWKLVYKPRPMGVDVLFFDLLRAINAKSRAVSFRCLDVLDRERYGWMEFVEHEECATRAAAKRFYQRAGALAFLAHWLGATDCHRENLVAAGEHPVLIDLETLAHPVRAGEIADAEAGAMISLAETPLRTGLLPLWQTRYTAGPPYDNSGLGGPLTLQSHFEVLSWKKVNTDRMVRYSSKQFSRHTAHRPYHQGKALVCRYYEHDIVFGFRHMAQVIEADATSQLMLIRKRIWQVSRRRVERPTAIYGVLLQRSLQLKCLTNGAERSLVLRTLPCPPGNEEDWESEIQSLEKMDVPYFRSHPSAMTAEAQDARKFPAMPTADAITLIRQSVHGKLRLFNGGIFPASNRPGHV